ncbi:MAG: 2Fe-2S iron-sulfur cluster-binding protein [Halobacteriaceae archaeon]
MTEHTVEFVGTDDVIAVSEKETILAACLRAGIAQEYSCRVGMCLACSARVLEGEVTQPAARGLSEREREEYCLTCMARPQSDLRIRRGEYPPSIEDAAGVGADASDAAPADD